MGPEFQCHRKSDQNTVKIPEFPEVQDAMKIFPHLALGRFHIRLQNRILSGYGDLRLLQNEIKDAI